MKRGQLTIFVLIGIILVATVFFATYVALQLSAEQGERRQDQLEDQQQAYDQLNQYLRSCVENRIANATGKIFRQGGYLYNDQNGTATRDHTVTYAPDGTTQANDVKIGLRATYPCDQAHQEPPAYPAGNTSFDDYNDYGENGACYDDVYDHQFSAGFLGLVNFPRTCTPSSSNRVDTINSDFTDVQCGRTLAINPVHSLETHLEDSTEDILRDCAANTSEVRSIGSSITLTDAPNVSIGYGDETTLFDAQVYFEADAATTTGTVQRTQFTYEADLPLLTVWNDIYQALKEEATKPNHNFSEALSEYSVQTDERSDHIVYEIQDNDIQWGAGPVTIITAVDKRPPILDYLNRHSKNGLNAVVEAGNSLYLKPDTVDPDDQATPTLTYEGLGETLTAIDPAGRAQPSDSLGEARAITSSSPPQAGNRLGDNPSGQHRINDPYAWGLYTARVNVEQNGEVGDYQDVNVLVVDNPALAITTDTPTEPEPLSLEAPITINGSDSQPPQAFGQQPLYNTNWSVNNNPVDAPINGFSTAAVTDASITNITDAHEALDLTLGNNSVTLSSTANTTYRDNVHHTVTENISVQRCKPNEDRAGQPYPYNDQDPYMTRNPCCTSSGEVAGLSKTCYTSNTVGSTDQLIDDLTTFNQTLNEYTETSIDYSIIQNAYDQLRSANGNGELRVQRQCGGARGNTCGGPINVDVTT
jgi:hypothetical protein